MRPLKAETEILKERISVLERNYERVLEEMVGMQQGMAQQDRLLHSMIAYFLQNDEGALLCLSVSFLFVGLFFVSFVSVLLGRLCHESFCFIPLLFTVIPQRIDPVSLYRLNDWESASGYMALSI